MYSILDPTHLQARIEIIYSSEHRHLQKVLSGIMTYVEKAYS
jgi:hypothetical protein